MTKAEAVNWIINLSADIGKAEHRSLWHYEQALSEIRDLLEGEDAVEVIRCKDCKHYQFSVSRAFACYVNRCEITGFEDVDDDDFCSRAEREQDG